MNFINSNEFRSKKNIYRNYISIQAEVPGKLLFDTILLFHQLLNFNDTTK